MAANNFQVLPTKFTQSIESHAESLLNFSQNPNLNREPKIFLTKMKKELAQTFLDGLEIAINMGKEYGQSPYSENLKELYREILEWRKTL